jgi:DHA3 family macrolide efflux protein-like MFS transporter
VVTSLFGIIGMGAGILFLGLLPGSGLWYAIGTLLVVGLMNPLANGPLIAILQSTVAPEIQGRILSLLGSLVTAMSPLSLAIAGPVADLLGIRFWYVLGGATMLAAGIGAFFVPAIIHLEDGRGALEEAVSEDSKVGSATG